MGSASFPRSFKLWIATAFAAGSLCGAGIALWLSRQAADDAPTASPSGPPARLESGPRPNRRPGAGTGAGRPAGGGATTAEAAVEQLRGILSMADIAARNDALRELLSRVPPDQFPALMQRFAEFIEKQEFEDEVSGLITAMSTFEVIAEHITATAPEATLGEIIKSEGKKVNDLAPLMLRQWAGRDFAAAMAFYESRVVNHKDGSLKRNCAEGLAREYAKIDPDSALNWVGKLSGDVKDNAVHAAFQTLSHRDSEAALRLVAERTDLPNREDIARGLAGGWAKTEPEKALRWALGLPPDIAKGAVKQSVEHLAEKDFSAAVRAVESMEAELQGSVVSELAGRVNPAESAAVVALVERQPEGDARADAARALMSKWAPQAPEDASRWLAAQPPGASRDQAIVGFSRSLAKENPEAALEWTATIGQPALRRERLDDQFAEWAKADRGAAESWLSSSTELPPEDRERLLNRISD